MKQNFKSASFLTSVTTFSRLKKIQTKLSFSFQITLQSIFHSYQRVIQRSASDAYFDDERKEE